MKIEDKINSYLTTEARVHKWPDFVAVGLKRKVVADTFNKHQQGMDNVRKSISDLFVDYSMGTKERGDIQKDILDIVMKESLLDLDNKSKTDLANVWFGIVTKQLEKLKKEFGIKD